MKLFNLLISEMGPLFLEHGIWVNGHVLREFLGMHQADVHTMFKELKKDGIDIPPYRIADLAWITHDARFFLQATCALNSRYRYDLTTPANCHHLI